MPSPSSRSPTRPRDRLLVRLALAAATTALALVTGSRDAPARVDVPRPRADVAAPTPAATPTAMPSAIDATAPPSAIDATAPPSAIDATAPPSAIDPTAPPSAIDPTAPPAAREPIAGVAIAAGQLPVLAHALRGRGVAEADLVGVFAAARESELDPLELLRILQTIASAPPGASTMNLGTWLSGQLKNGLRGRELRRALLLRLKGATP